MLDHRTEATLIGQPGPDVRAKVQSPEADQADYAYLRRTAQAEPVLDPTPVQIIDLFSGLGGMTLGAMEGARRAGRGAALALAVDAVEAPLDVLRTTLRAGTACRVADLKLVPEPLATSWSSQERELFGGVPSGGLLMAGPPCQGHSSLNNHTRHDDPKNDLYVAVARVARLTDPKAVIIENVRGLGRDRRNSLARCKAVLEEIGYKVTGKLLDLHALGVPQRRVRYVLVATRDRPMEWDLRTAMHRDLRWAIGDLLGKEERSPLDTPARVSPTNRERINYLFAKDIDDLPNTERPKCHQDDHSYVSMYGRLQWSKPAQTVTSGFGSMGQGRYVHPERRRTLTPHEAARLQFLPDFVTYGEATAKRSALATMIGNVAPPKLTMALVERLLAQELL